MLLPPPCPPRFPYTTLFRSDNTGHVNRISSERSAFAEPGAVPAPGGGPAGARARGDRGRHAWRGEGCPGLPAIGRRGLRSEEHTSELQSPCNHVCRLLLEKK